MSSKDITDLQVIQACEEADTQDYWPDVLLGEMTGEGNIACLEAMIRAFNKGYLTSPDRLVLSVPSKRGYELLKGQGVK